MHVGGGGALRSDTNVTPLVDVVLVLLIIFMVITPVVQMGYLVRVPPNAPANLPPSAVEFQFIVRFMGDGRMFMNIDALTADSGSRMASGSCTTTTAANIVPARRSASRRVSSPTMRRMAPKSSAYAAR